MVVRKRASSGGSKLTIGYPLCEEIIEPEAEVVDSESIRSGNVLVQSTHPGPQPRPQGIST